MYIRELTALIAVAENGSFLQAAKKLYLTPASVMNQLNRLEKIVGAQLVERTNQGTKLTAAGQSLCRDARQMIEFSDAAIDRARQAAAAAGRIIRVGTSLLRPSRPLMDLWAQIDDGRDLFQIRIVPFDDEPSCLESVLSSLGTRIDCIVGPCDSLEWQQTHSILRLGELPCRVALPYRHRLAKMERLTWTDLDGETFILLERGDSPVLNAMRDDIVKNHSAVSIRNAPNKYDTAIFNECDETNSLMETLDIWQDVHPSLVTLPMEWQYAIPWGIVYAKEPPPAVKDFISLIRDTVRPA